MGEQKQMPAIGGSRSGPALAVSHLTKRFGARTAYEDVSFEVSRGEVFGFLGPNGAGKTTMVRTLATLLTPSAGEAAVAGLALSPENGSEIRARISVMPESPGLYLRLSVRENLACFAELYEVDHPARAMARALAAVGLTDRADDTCGALSKGLRQRVALARALLPAFEVLFLDEPTSGLDPAATREVHDLIAALRGQGITIFLTTHRLEEADRLCDRVAILNTSLRTIGRPAELRERLFGHALTVRTVADLVAPESILAGVAGVRDWRRESPGTYTIIVSDPTIAAPPLTRALVGAGAEVLSIAEEHRSLEDVYLQLIAADAPEVDR